MDMGDGRDTSVMCPPVIRPVAEVDAISQAISPSPLLPNNANPSPEIYSSPKDAIVSAALKIAAQNLQHSDPDVWGVLTAISENARRRRQGINVLLTAEEHHLGRLVGDAHFRIESSAVSARHCTIYKKQLNLCDQNSLSSSQACVFLKDSSTNGTFLNWVKLCKCDGEMKVKHGDIISLASPPEHERAVAFVYRDVIRSSSGGGVLKRKADDNVSENKRLKGIGIGAPEGPISLDDFRRLQRSNTELRKQLESEVLAVETLQNENRVSVECHENQLKELKESMATSYASQLNVLKHVVEVKERELGIANKVSSEQKRNMDDLNERLTSSVQSCAEANEIIRSQKVSLSELKAQLDEERDKRKEEREKASIDIKAAIQKAHLEAEEELKRISDTALRREREQQEVINKLQELEKEKCLLVETLRSKLEETRQKLVMSDNKVRQLESQLQEMRRGSETERKKTEELEIEMSRLGKELESEKAAREEAWAKVSVLELEMNAVMRDLDFERRRLKGARERIMLRETQLRAFYATTEEISVLFAKQQEQLKAMQKTLEDEEKYGSASMEVDTSPKYFQTALGKGGETSGYPGNDAVNQTQSSSSDTSTTEKHECCSKSQGGAQHAQETDRNVTNGLSCEIGVGTELVLETECVENSQQNFDLNTVQVDDDEAHIQVADDSCGKAASRNMDEEKQALCQMIGIVAPDLKAEFDAALVSGHAVKDGEEAASGSETIGGDDTNAADDCSVEMGSTLGSDLEAGNVPNQNNMIDDDDDDGDDDGATLDDSEG